MFLFQFFSIFFSTLVASVIASVKKLGCKFIWSCIYSFSPSTNRAIWSFLFSPRLVWEPIVSHAPISLTIVDIMVAHSLARRNLSFISLSIRFQTLVGLFSILHLFTYNWSYHVDASDCSLRVTSLTFLSLGVFM